MDAEALRREALRRSYRPRRVRLLLVGESPPAGGTFFYHEEKNLLSTSTACAFKGAYGIEFEDNASFLRFFQSRGCYLEDLSLKPVNTMRPRERERELQASVPSLSRRIRRLGPVVVVAILRRIERYVKEALAMTDCPAVFRVLPFPVWRRNTYIDGLSDLLRRYLPRKA